VNLLNGYLYTENRLLCPHAQTTLQPTVFVPVLDSIPQPLLSRAYEKRTESGRLSAEIKLPQEIIQHNVLCLPRLGACRDVCLLKLERKFPHMTGKF